MRDATGEEARVLTRCGVGGDRPNVPADASCPVTPHRSDEDARFGISERGGHDSGVLERFPRKLEKEPLLRIDLLRFAGRDAEEVGVERVDGFEEAAPA